jgi:hypothetical protein
LLDKKHGKHFRIGAVMDEYGSDLPQGKTAFIPNVSMEFDADQIISGIGPPQEESSR